MITSRIKVGHPARAFRYDDPDERAQFAPLCVLYDDLMLEFTAVNEEAMPLLDKSGRDNRLFYFVRRTLGTLSEMRRALAVLEQNKTFQRRKVSWEKGARDGWDEAAAFFTANHKFLKGMAQRRGRPFPDGGSEFAIDNVEPHAVGAIEIYRTGKGANVRMKFSYELVVVAMVTMRDANMHTAEEFLREAFTFLLTRCVMPGRRTPQNWRRSNAGATRTLFDSEGWVG